MTSSLRPSGRATEADPAEAKLVKKCSGPCGRTLPVTEFRRHKGHGDGYDSQCKDCMRNAAAAKRQQLDPVAAATPPKDPRSYSAAQKRMTAPLLALVAHWHTCRGCDRCEYGGKLVEAAAAAFELFFNAYSADALGGLPAHAKLWVSRALSTRRLLLNVPPRHAKTTLMAIWFPIWLWACSRDFQVIIVSKTTALGEKISRKVAAELETNVKLITEFGRFRPRDLTRPWRVSKGELEIEGKNLALRSGDLSLQIRGSGQQILGMEADWVIADDITDRRVATSEVERTGEWDFFLGDVLTRLSPEGRAFCIGQRVHAEDIYGRLARLVDDDGTPAWDQIRTPAILDEEEGTVLWPAVWSYERLVDRRRAIGSSLFSCMFQQEPEFAGDFVERWWLEGNGSVETPGCYDRNRVVGTGWVQQDYTFIPTTRVLSIDPSPTAFCGMVVADIIWQPRAQFFYCAIVDVRRDKMGLRSMVDTARELVELYHPQVCVYETNIVKWLREDPAWNRLTPLFQQVIGQNTTQWNKKDTLLGVWSLASDFEGGRIRFPWADRESRDAMEPLIGEVLAYPNGQTDDVLMALWFIKANYKMLMPRNLLSEHFDKAPQPGAWDMTHMQTMWNEKGTIARVS